VAVAAVDIASLIEYQGAGPDFEDLGHIPIARKQVPNFQ
jgi:hypothetical protein